MTATKVRIEHSAGRYHTRPLTDEEAANAQPGDVVVSLEGNLRDAYRRHCEQDAVWQALWRAQREIAQLKAQASDPTGETLPELPVRTCTDDHHGSLTQPLGQLGRQPRAPLKEDVAVDVLGGEDLDDVGVFEVPLPEPHGLGEGGPDELLARQLRQSLAQRLVADPLPGLLGEVRADVEPDRAGGDGIGHLRILHGLKQRRKFHANHCFLYFEVDREQQLVSIETSWLPNLRPVREALVPIGFERDRRGMWRARVGLDDFVGVIRRVSRALELLLTEAASMITSEEEATA